MSVELLAPVGSLESFKAAIQNHADAVYLGGKQFGARAFADNFSNQEIKEMIEYAHLFDVLVYVTINTLVYDHEFAELIEFVDFLYLNDCDAVIVQDLGVANIIKMRYPDLHLHASTQMNIHSVEQAKTLKKIGFNRIVLARELSLEEIINIKNNVDIEIEVFVHGALCVSHSGNCYLSSIIGKRSGNRGRCAQPCRLEYSIADESGYLISPKDLNTIDRIEYLLDAKIDSLKIEGRMKRPEYVAQIVKSYHSAIKHHLHQTEFDLEKNQKDLKKIFNRSFTKGFLFKEENINFVNKLASNHIGVEVGKVVYSSEEWVEIKITDTLRKGDSIRIVASVVDAITINQMYIGNKLVEVAHKGDIIRVRPHKNNLINGIVLLTSSYEQINELTKTYNQEYRKIDISGELYIEDNYLMLVVNDGVNFVKEKSLNPISMANNIPSNDRMVEQIKKTHSTVFEFKQLEVRFNEVVFISIKDVNDLRRRTLEKLSDKRKVKHLNRKLLNINHRMYFNFERENNLKVKVRNEEQLKAVLAFPVNEIYVTDKKLFTYKEKYPKIKFSYVLPRINKSKVEISEISHISSDLSYLDKATTSVYMNITNVYAINLLESLNVKTISLSLELSFKEIQNIVLNYRKLFHSLPNLEMMVYGRYELMMMKYCPISTTVGCDGCKEVNVNLKDRKGFEFPLLKENCLIKLMNSKKLHLIDYLDEIYQCGINNLLLDFTDENYQEVYDVCDIYFNNNKNIQLNDVTYGHFKEGVL